MDAKTKSAELELERIERDIKRVEAEQHRRMMLSIASGEATCLRVIVHEGENEDEACAKARAEAGLPDDRKVVFILRVIVPHTDEFLQQVARARAESDAILAAQVRGEQDEWEPPPRATVPDQLNATPISVVIDDNERVPDTIASYFIIADGAVILSDQGGRPLAKGAYCHPLRVGEDADRIAKRLLVKFDLDRGRGSGEIAYLETRR
jgi:hypothetical protein